MMMKGNRKHQFNNEYWMLNNESISRL